MKYHIGTLMFKHGQLSKFGAASLESREMIDEFGIYWIWHTWRAYKGRGFLEDLITSCWTQDIKLSGIKLHISEVIFTVVFVCIMGKESVGWEEGQLWSLARQAEHMGKFSTISSEYRMVLNPEEPLITCLLTDWMTSPLIF